MRKEILVPTLVCLLFATADGQVTSRPFDNFDTVAGVQIKTNQAADVADRNASESTDRKRPKHYLPSPPYGEQYKNTGLTVPDVTIQSKSLQIAIRVNQGDAEPKNPRPVSTVKSPVIRGSYLSGFSTGDPEVDSYIVDSSRRYGIDPLLIYSQMAQESSFKRLARSHKGASGLMQLMPATARRLGVTNIYDPKQNIEGGVKYMRILLNMFDQDLTLALAGYNAGEGAVIKYGYQIPPYNETQDYVRRISSRYRSMTASTSARFVNNNKITAEPPSNTGLR